MAVCRICGNVAKSAHFWSKQGRRHHKNWGIYPSRGEYKNIWSQTGRATFTL